MNSILEAIESRISVNHFRPDVAMDDAIVQALISYATRAPSAYNLQNWRFIAVRSAEAKERLRAVAYRQQKIVEASVVFIVCGTLSAHEQFQQVIQPSVDQGVMEQSLADRWVAQIKAIHTDNPGMQRDEAVRSASLAAMTLMLAAKGMGLASCPMVGFDPKGVAKEFGLKDTDVPVILVAVGHEADGNWPQKPRRPLHEVLEIV